MSDHDDARRIRDALRDPQALCSALGLLEGAEGYGRGCSWRRISGGVQVCCPWHDEKTPSCSVTRGPDGTVRVHCFGCSEGGDALSLVAAVHGLDMRRGFAAVLEHAADLAGVARPSSAPSTGSSSVRSLPRRAAPVAAPAPSPEALTDGTLDELAAVLRAHAPVTSSPVAMEYLRARAIDHGEALGWFALPFELRDVEALRAVVVEAIGLDAWKRSGLAHGPNGEHWRRRWCGRLVIPWEDPNGAVRTLEGRALSERFEGGKYERPEGRPALWPWGCSVLREEASEGAAVAFVEGAIDAHSFNTLARAHRVECYALALPGVGAWRDEWARLARGRDAVIALDADKTGRDPRNVARLREALLREARSVSVRTPSTGKDWNDTLRAMRTTKATG